MQLHGKSKDNTTNTMEKKIWNMDDQEMHVLKQWKLGERPDTVIHNT